MWLYINVNGYTHIYIYICYIYGYIYIWLYIYICMVIYIIVYMVIYIYIYIVIIIIISNSSSSSIIIIHTYIYIWTHNSSIQPLDTGYFGNPWIEWYYKFYDVVCISSKWIWWSIPEDGKVRQTLRSLRLDTNATKGLDLHKYGSEHWQ